MPKLEDKEIFIAQGVSHRWYPIMITIETTNEGRSFWLIERHWQPVDGGNPQWEIIHRLGPYPMDRVIEEFQDMFLSAIGPNSGDFTGEARGDRWW